MRRGSVCWVYSQRQRSGLRLPILRCRIELELAEFLSPPTNGLMPCLDQGAQAVDRAPGAQETLGGMHKPRFLGSLGRQLSAQTDESEEV